MGHLTTQKRKQPGKTLWLYWNPFMVLGYALGTSMMLLVDGNVYQLFPKSTMTTFYPLKMMTVQFPSSTTTVYYACSTIPAVHDSSLIHYGNLARQLTELSLHHWQALSTNLGGKAMQPRPALHSKRAMAFQIKGLLNHHVSPNPMESGRARVTTRKHKMPLSLLISGMNSTFEYRNSLSRFF